MKKLVGMFLIGAMLTFAGEANQKKIAADAAAADPQSTIIVIVQWNCPIGPSTKQAISALGGVLVSEFKFVRQGIYRIPASALTGLSANPDVKYVSPDRQIRNKLDNTAAAVNASALWGAGWTGSDVGVAVIDSGVNADVNLASLVDREDFTGATGSSAGKDQFGHGQHVAGIIASTSVSTATPGGPVSSYTRNFKGIAPGASLIDLRVLDQNGTGNDSSFIAAVDRALALQQQYNIRVINISLGRPIFESYTVDPICQAVEAAWKSGIVVVVAAGNGGRDTTYAGYGTVTAPGNDPFVITVGAMKTEGTYDRSDDLIASYSSKGPTAIDHVVKPDIVAPGNLVVSLLAANSTLAAANPANGVLQSYYENTNNGQGKKVSSNFFVLSGTSMAAPVVSGAAAALIQARPLLTPDQVKILLMQTAYKVFPASSSVTDPITKVTYTDYYDIFTVGAGYLDLGAALAAVDSVPALGTAISPVANYDPTSGIVSLTYDPTSVFGNSALWGTRALWGTDSVWGAAVLSSDRALWGTSAGWGNTTTASRALWGTSTGVAASSTTSAEETGISITGEP